MSIPTSCIIRHISLVPWCVGLDRFHCLFNQFNIKRRWMKLYKFFWNSGIRQRWSNSTFIVVLHLGVKHNCGVMANVFTSSVVDRGIGSRSGQTNDYKLVLLSLFYHIRDLAHDQPPLKATMLYTFQNWDSL